MPRLLDPPATSKVEAASGLILRDSRGSLRAFFGRLRRGLFFRQARSKTSQTAISVGHCWVFVHWASSAQAMKRSSETRLKLPRCREMSGAFDSPRGCSFSLLLDLRSQMEISMTGVCSGMLNTSGDGGGAKQTGCAESLYEVHDPGLISIHPSPN